MCGINNQEKVAKKRQDEEKGKETKNSKSKNYQKAVSVSALMVCLLVTKLIERRCDNLAARPLRNSLAAVPHLTFPAEHLDFTRKHQ